MPEKSLIEVEWNNVWKLNKKRKEDVLCFVASVGERKKFWVPTRSRTSDLRISALRCYTTEPQRFYGELGSLQMLYFVFSPEKIIFRI